jgi:ElaB/YqjD/DUF883 family membrane-anchored ribosome-binding protein
MESEINRNVSAEPGATSARDVVNKGTEAYEQTKRSMSHAYEQSANAFEQTYDQALEYGRNNPGKALLIAFGIGVGIGMLVLGSGRRSKASRYGEPIVNALSNMAMEFIRNI